MAPGHAGCGRGRPGAVSQPLIITFSFLPIFTLQGQEGRLFSPLAFTKTYAMAAAALLSITLIPVLMGLLIRDAYPARRPIRSIAGSRGLPSGD
jgi:Cu/Ag efflux pump CusA